MNKNMKRIIVFYIQPKTGHHAAAKAIEKAFNQLYPSTEVLVLDFMEYVNPVIAELLHKTYFNVIKRSPETWRYLYDNPAVFKKTKKFRDLIIRLNLTRIRKLITSYKPNAIICTQAIPCSSLSYYKKTKKLSIPIIGVVTDFTTHSYWLHDEVDFYIVPSEREKWRLMSKGIGENRIKVFGIPTDPKFKIKHDKALLEQKHDLAPHLPKILLMGGSQGLGAIKNIINRLSDINVPLQLLVVTGINKSLAKKLINGKEKGKYPASMKVFSHIDYIDELLEASDIVITKPGGLTISEAFIKQKPMILINPIPGQESQNCEYLLGEKAAVKADTEEELINILEELLKNPAELKEISFQAQRLKKPDASEDIANFVMNL